ncbi:MAG: glucosyl transferase [Ignavibacterium sp.]|nr:glucosyl transferase [Ignavibacterium sp.]
MKFLTLVFFVSTALLLLNNCDSTNPKLEPDLLLKLEDVSCTEAWLQLTTNNIQLPAIVNLKQSNPAGDTKSHIFNLNTKDPLFYIDSLLPNQTYKLQVSNIQNQVSSNELSITTLDTTSHNFTWQTFEFGQHSSSVLYDVAIIDENNIWAVGEIYMNDSLGQPIRYNAVHWNGQIWELIKTGGFGGYPRRTVFAFSENEVWFDGVIKWDGVNYSVHMNGWPLMPNGDGWQVNKMWGNSSNDLYAVGNSGNIARYNGRSWVRIVSGTDANLQDISVTPDLKEIWTCGWSNSTGRVSLLKINNSNVESLWDSQTNTTLNIYRGTLLNSLYANGNSEFVLVGGQVLRHSAFFKNQVKLEWVKTFNGSKVLELGYYAYRIKGSNKNNIIAAGDAAMIWHFNGATWYKHSELYNFDDRLYGLAVTDNIIVAVGKRYSPGTLGGGLLILGRR